MLCTSSCVFYLSRAVVVHKSLQAPFLSACLGNVCRSLCWVGLGTVRAHSDGMRLCFEFALKTGLIMATALTPGC